jgi:Arm DNA-binding domain
LLVTPSGSKLWRFDYRYDGKRKTLALGKWDRVELTKAREKRDVARKSLAEGIDPCIPQGLGSKVTKNSFEAVALAWHASSKVAWTLRNAKLVLGRLDADIFPHLGRDDIDSIEPPAPNAMPTARQCIVPELTESGRNIEFAKSWALCIAGHPRGLRYCLDSFPMQQRWRFCRSLRPSALPTR